MKGVLINVLLEREWKPSFANRRLGDFGGLWLTLYTTYKPKGTGIDAVLFRLGVCRNKRRS